MSQKCGTGLIEEGEKKVLKQTEFPEPGLYQHSRLQAFLKQDFLGDLQSRADTTLE